MLTRRSRRDRQDGAALIEFALLTPLLMLLVIGAVEVAWLFAQEIDVRHGAREAGRMAATDHGDEGAIRDALCVLIDDSNGVSLALTGSAGSVGDEIAATVSRPAETLTGFLDWAFPPTLVLDATATFALEVSPPSWTDSGSLACP